MNSSNSFLKAEDTSVCFLSYSRYIELGSSISSISLNVRRIG